MFIAHLPAGYLLTKNLQKRFEIDRYLFAGLIGSIFPDFDIPYFFLVDHQQTPHHSYWIHLPFYWMLIPLISLTFLFLSKKKEYLTITIIFLSNVMLHLILDTVVGKIEWLYPLSTKSFAFFEVPSVYHFWFYNFLFHWTFLFEIAIIVWALFVLLKSKNSKSV